jgi:sulfur carrier protein ThiS
MLMEVEHLKTLLTLRIDLIEDARRLQAAEYERRLEQLNHEHQRATDKERDFLPRQQYEIQRSEQEDKIQLSIKRLIELAPLEGEAKAFRVALETLAAKIQEIEKRLTSMWSYGAGAVGVLTVVIVLINLAIKLIWKTG